MISLSIKKFWWGIFFGTLIGVLLLAPESNFSIRVRELFYTIQYAVVDVLNAAAIDPLKAILAFAMGFSIMGAVNYGLDSAVSQQDRKAYVANVCCGFLFMALSILACAHPEIIERLK